MLKGGGTDEKWMSMLGITFYFTVLFLNSLLLYLDTFLCTPDVLYVSNSLVAISSDLSLEIQPQLGLERIRSNSFVSVDANNQYLCLSRKMKFHSHTELLNVLCI